MRRARLRCSTCWGSQGAAPAHGACRSAGSRPTYIRAGAAQVEAALKKFLSPQRVLLRDKLTWCAGTFQIVAAAYWLGAAPATFHRLYTAEAVVLLVLRWVQYRWSKQHYYLLDVRAGPVWVWALRVLGPPP